MKKLIALVLVTFPAFVSAQTQLNNIDDVASKATKIGNLIIGILISLAVLYIIYAVVKYLIAGSSDEEARAKGAQAILYGVIGLFVILSIWGLVAILRNSFKTADQRPQGEIERTTDLPTPRYVN